MRYINDNDRLLAKAYENHNDREADIDDQHGVACFCFHQEKQITTSQKPHQERRYYAVLGGPNPDHAMRASYEEYSAAHISSKACFATTKSTHGRFAKQVWSSHAAVPAADLPPASDNQISTIERMHQSIEESIVKGEIRSLTTRLSSPVFGQGIYNLSENIRNNECIMNELKQNGFKRKIYYQGTVIDLPEGIKPGQPGYNFNFTAGSFNANQSQGNLFNDGIKQALQDGAEVWATDGAVVKKERLLQVTSTQPRRPGLENSHKDFIKNQVSGWADVSRQPGETWHSFLRTASIVPASITASKQLASHMDKYRLVLSSEGFPEEANLPENIEAVRKVQDELPKEVVLTNGQAMMIVKIDAERKEYNDITVFNHVSGIHEDLRSPDELNDAFDDSITNANRDIASNFLDIRSIGIERVKTLEDVFHMDSDEKYGEGKLLKRGYTFVSGFNHEDENGEIVKFKGLLGTLKDSPKTSKWVKTAIALFDDLHNKTLDGQEQSHSEKLSRIIVDGNFRQVPMDAVSEQLPSIIKKLGNRDHFLLGKPFPNAKGLYAITTEAFDSYLHKDAAIKEMRRRYENAGIQVVPE